MPGAGGVGISVVPAAKRLSPYEDRAGAAADILRILAGDPVRYYGGAGPGVDQELKWFLVHHHD